MDTFAKRIKKLRTESNLTQEEMASKVGTTRGTWASWEIGRREPDFATVQKLADYFDVTTDYLLGRTDNPKGILDEPTEMEVQHVLKNNKIMLNEEELTEDQKKEVISFIEFILQRDRKEKQKEQEDQENDKKE